MGRPRAVESQYEIPARSLERPSKGAEAPLRGAHHACDRPRLAFLRQRLNDERLLCCSSQTLDLTFPSSDETLGEIVCLRGCTGDDLESGKGQEVEPGEQEANDDAGKQRHFPFGPRGSVPSCNNAPSGLGSTVQGWQL